MIFETTHLIVDPARTEAFEAAVADCTDLFAQAQGCHGMRLERFVGAPGHYHLRVGWSRLEDHTIAFRRSAAYDRWRGAVGMYFIQDPCVVHTEPVFE